MDGSVSNWHECACKSANIGTYHFHVDHFDHGETLDGGLCLRGRDMQLPKHCVYAPFESPMLTTLSQVMTMVFKCVMRAADTHGFARDCDSDNRINKACRLLVAGVCGGPRPGVGHCRSHCAQSPDLSGATGWSTG